MSKHTPGPWHVVMSDNATPFIQHENGHDWTDIDDRTSRVCHMPAEIVENFNSLNNARLIAAAPELLEALEALECSAPDVCCRDFNHRKGDFHEADEACPPLDRWQAACLSARAAIAKARGDS